MCIDEALWLDLAQDLSVADQRLDVALGRHKDASHHRIGFRMNAGSVERVVAIGDAQEAGALFKRLRPYGPSPITSSTHSTKQIDLWMDVVSIPGHAVGKPTRDKPSIPRFSFRVSGAIMRR
jgi:hypothetical protein